MTALGYQLPNWSRNWSRQLNGRFAIRERTMAPCLTNV
jgi:hypothetical protein